MTISDAQFRIGVVGAAALLAVGITVVRFCGSVRLPDSETRSAPPTGTAPQLTEQANASPTIYQDFLARDAAAAGTRTPIYEEMKRKLPSRIDEAREVLEVGKSVTKAGLKLTAARDGAAIVLAIENTMRTDLGYLVKTELFPNVACSSVEPLPFNAVVIAGSEREVRAECKWRDGMAIVVTRVETVELSPLSAWYLRQLPPDMLAIDPRITPGHRKPKTAERCITAVPQAVHAGIEDGKISWRDLVDFYARHRCQTYSFPPEYRALRDGDTRKIPAM